MMEPEIMEMIDWVGGQVDDESDVATQVEEVEVVGDGQLGTEMVEGEGDAHEGEGDGEVHTEVRTEMVEGEGDAHEGEGDGYEGDGEDHTTVGTKMVEGEGDAHEGEGDGYEGDGEDHTTVGTKMVEGQGDAHEGEGDGYEGDDGPFSNEELKEKKNFKKKKAYIAWDDDNETISDLSESDEEANICLVVNDDAGSQ
ncbi:hypothetical protein LR48_Vigan07g144600 [Vigna angularis]|uniref:Uncharacterized protein n=1 Tax=Phaseolus angularis TaxID=3914 RepID=A0A0L9UYS8_PHAAN|nr:hypothetical protein LR48_Vigan07g144600 [Vigna angularis]